MKPHAWQVRVLREFDRAAERYDRSARLQRSVAWRLAQLCRREGIADGLWVDLGTGTGQLAKALEQLHPGRKVQRIDGSEAMLRGHPDDAEVLHWDLTTGLPDWSEAPTLLASSFCLHWLPEPQHLLQQWILRLAPAGLLAVALPVEGCFPQWHQSARRCGVRCTALPFPSTDALLKTIPAQQLRMTRRVSYTVTSPSLPLLLKPLRRIGAGTSPQSPLPLRDWRRLQQGWSDRQSDGQLRLTWVIQLLLIRG
ncbi:malonyl-CoA O-methyltransferase [Synechococcus sp. PROS-7-1]|uniref:methyltransferase domain-containing protein n=1 Tax=Synechococcus sp. PROS-7-1 TaxID=1442556 RepID=UPI001647F611|nr:methyltransferase domain-containing protein [Synechococcus sp. PROS-7-1]QNI86095.1 malonyl-CoA O-methyltransferase [Synechococcus sp. PROS-7-1]